MESSTPSSKFKVEIDAEEWKTPRSDGAEDWHFNFKTLDKQATVPVDQQGTTIKISGLHTSVGESFGDESFIKRAWQEIAVAHAISMDKGLNVTLNEVPLRYMTQLVLQLKAKRQNERLQRVRRSFLWTDLAGQSARYR